MTSRRPRARNSRYPFSCSSSDSDLTQMSSSISGKIDEPANRDQKNSKSVNTTPLPLCEITRISFAEWRRIRGRPIRRRDFSLITVGPKGQGENSLRSEVAGFLDEANQTTIGSSAGPLKLSDSSNEQAYRMLLNSRAELMEVLGDIFNLQIGPGLFIWIWPFKHLIKYEKKIRERLSQEEDRCKGRDKPHDLVSAPSPANRDLIGPERDEYVQSGHIHGILPPNIEHVAEIKPKRTGQEGHDRISSQDVEEEVGALQITKPIPENEDESITDIPQDNQQTTGQQVRADKEDANSTYKPTRTARKKSQEGDNKRLRDELRCIVDFMENDMKDIFSVQRTIANGTRRTIAYDYLWLLFKPGDAVFARGEPERAYIVLHVAGGRALQRQVQKTDPRDRGYYKRYEGSPTRGYLARNPKTSPFFIDCFYVDFDGYEYGSLPQRFEISEFQGEVPIHTLEVFPGRFVENSQQLKRSLIKRGKRFMKFARVDHKYYSGKTVRELQSLEIPGEVHGEIMIDFELALKAFRIGRGRVGPTRDNRFGSGAIAKPTSLDERGAEDPYGLFYSGKVLIMEDSSLDNELTFDYMETTSLLKQRPSNEKLPNEILMLLPPRVYGFSLLDREWYAFDVSKIEDVKNSDQGFDNLVISKEHKKIMQALVQRERKDAAAANGHAGGSDGGFSMDVVRGKGNGLIILLHGVPGVGKTSTAECVAAQTKRPLLPITCGDIGTTPEQVERRLTEYFDMARKWGCVLLLDEADVFLAQREKGGDLERNGVVSVFLRVLEYYSGILILTTNRVGQFDEAFISRVHIKLYYPALDKKSTLEIWKMNMRRIVDNGLNITVKEAEIEAFAREMWVVGMSKPSHHWNGRQIRNAFQTAIALAKWDHQNKGNDSGEGPVLSIRHFQVVADTSSDFESYVSGMHGVPEDQHNYGTLMAREQLRGKDASPRLIGKSAQTREMRRGKMKAKTFREEEDEEDMDSDEDKENLQKRIKDLTDKLGELECLADRNPRDVSVSKPVRKAISRVHKEGEDSSSTSDEAE